MASGQVVVFRRREHPSHLTSRIGSATAFASCGMRWCDWVAKIGGLDTGRDVPMDG